MKSVILSIGDELVLGQTVDTNSAWLAQQLAAVGCEVIEHRTVGDDAAAIARAVNDCAPRCGALIITGGLGPTDDDLTRQAVAAAAGVELVMCEPWLEKMAEFFRLRNRPMVNKNRIQAFLPAGARMLDNPNGTACGFALQIRAGCELFAMPGVPKEMKPMFRDFILPGIEIASGGAVIAQQTLHTFGVGESQLAEMLGDLMDRQRNPSVGTTVSNNVVSLRINARSQSRESADSAIDSTLQHCHAKLGDLIFGEGEESLASAVAALLRGGRTADETPPVQTVSTAESCTGGLLAKYLTDLPGSSAYFKMGFVTYSNKAKYERLGVSEQIIGTYGAVSEPVVLAMARNARRLAATDYALAISGIAGPDGGSPTKPVGTVCIALAHLPPDEMTGRRRNDKASRDQEQNVYAVARTFNFGGDREMVRDRAAKMALALLRYRLLGVPAPF